MVRTGCAHGAYGAVRSLQYTGRHGNLWHKLPLEFNGTVYISLDLGAYALDGQKRRRPHSGFFRPVRFCRVSHVFPIFEQIDVSHNPEITVRRIFLALSIVLGFLQAWASRMTIVSDTVSYLDIGDFMWHGHWSLAVNGLWNPLYSAILGVAIGLCRPSFYWEYPLVHLVLFLIFILTLFCFDFFLRQLVLLRRETESRDELSVPAWIWFCIGYILFLWSSLRLIGVSETNPDMLVAAFFYLACGLLVRIRRGSAGWPAHCTLGAALGLGYLTKSIMFPVSIACLAVAFSIGRPQARRALASAAIFLAIAGPYVVVACPPPKAGLHLETRDSITMQFM